MSLAKSFRDLLLQSSEVTAMVGTGVYSDQPPQTAKAPFVVFFVVSEVPTNCIDRGTYFDESLIQVEAYGSGRIEADALWREVRAQIDGYVGESAGVRMKVSQSSGRYWMTDRPETGSDVWRYKSVQDFTVFYNSNAEAI